MFGKSIKSLLGSSSSLSTLVSTKIYPYVLPKDTALPAVTYAILSVEPEYNKGAWALDNISFAVQSYAKDYSDLQDVVSAVRTALELKTAGYGTQVINRIYLDSQDEGYDYEGDYFYNSLNFKVVLNNY